MHYILSEQFLSDNTAASKAREDVEMVAVNCGYERLIVSKLFSESIIAKIINQGIVLLFWLKIWLKVKRNSILVVQHPLRFRSFGRSAVIWMIRKAKNVKVARVLHDIELIRQITIRPYNIRTDREIFTATDFVICHNKKMAQYLISKQVSNERMVSIQIFDYLLKYGPVPEKRYANTIVIAGNLSTDKSMYVYQLDELSKNINFDLYGPNYSAKRKCDNIIYHGSFAPEKLPYVFSGGFGLVWDGNVLTTCGGNTGRYLKYNNPHKVSLYLVSKLPVIVWSQSAIADFIKKERVGICIDSLYELEKIIKEITPNQYYEMAHNASRISMKLRNGYFTSSALDALENCKWGNL